MYLILVILSEKDNKHKMDKADKCWKTKRGNDYFWKNF